MNKSAGRVTLENICKCYGDVEVIGDLNLEIVPGELVTLLGPSGCGKTTTLRMIAGLEHATSGQISIGGKDVTHQAATYRNVAMVFQSYALFPHLSVLENVSYGLSVSSMPKKMIKRKALEGLDMVGLSGYGDRLPSELSGGQQQRVAVARAVVLEPEVLLFDEPLSNLDAKLRRHVREEIRQIQLSLGLTAVYVTHDQEEAMAVSDRIIVMRDGAIAQAGTPEEIYERPKSEFIADFIGDANTIPCDVISIENENAIIEVDGLVIKTNAQMAISGKAKLAVHPQGIKLSSERKDGSLHGRVTYSAYLGSHIEYTVKTAVCELFVIDNTMQTRFELNEDVYAELAAKTTTLIPSD